MKRDIADRRAHYACVLALVRHAGDPEPIIAQGDWHGTIVDAPRGTGGFGYDPHFLDPSTGLTGAELPLARAVHLIREHAGDSLKQVVMALASNAAQAMPSGGTITVPMVMRAPIGGGIRALDGRIGVKVDIGRAKGVIVAQLEG